MPAFRKRRMASEHGPIVPYQWSGGPDGEEWTLTIEHDCMSEGAPFTVTVEIENFDNDAGQESCTLADLSPNEAREAASALMVYAFLAEKAERDREARRG